MVMFWHGDAHLQLEFAHLVIAVQCGIQWVHLEISSMAEAHTFAPSTQVTYPRINANTQSNK